jgi:hypothetical protein
MNSAFKFLGIRTTASIIFALALSILLSGCQRGVSEAAASDRKREGFYGSVKSARTETSKLIKRASDYEEGPREIVETDSFDTRGNLTEESYSTVAGNRLYMIKYSYNESGRKSEGAILDPIGNIRQHRVYTYDDRGNLTEQASYNTEGGLHSKSEYSYDGRDLLTEWSTFNAKGALVDRWVYGYDDKGNRNVETRYFADGSVDTKHVLTLDEKGNRVEASGYNAKGELMQKEKYSYEFASTGNWIKRITSKAAGKPDGQNFEPVEVTYREIAYYQAAS